MAAKDKRLYARFDIGFDEHDKVYPLSDAAFRALVEATLYARRQLTDGFLAERLAVKRWGVEVIEELTANDPDKPSLVSVEGGWQIHDFAEHQTTNADIQAKREAGAKGGKAKAGRTSSKGVAGAREVLEQKRSTTLAKSESESDTDLLHTHLVSPSSSARESGTDSEDDRALRELASGKGIDLEAVITAASGIGRDLNLSQAYQIAMIIARKSKSELQHPTRYVLTSIEREPFEVQKWIDTEVMT